MGNVFNEKRYTIDEITSAINNSAGIMSTVAKNLGCSWYTAQKYVRMYEETQRAYEEENERVLDLAESKMIEHIQSGDIHMIKYMLATKGKKRGYTEKTEIEHSGDMAVNININGIKK